MTWHGAGALLDIPDGGMRQVEIADRKFLLVRRGAQVLAVDGLCPHAGGPLAEGVLHGDTVFCPWHKAAFNLRTGICTEPPALDDLMPIPVQVRDGTVVLEIVEAAPMPAAPEGDERCFVIIGSGAAGTCAAQELRRVGFAGRLVLISREAELPYDRTIQSKYVLSGKQGGEKSPLHDAAFYQRQKIERLVAEVTGLDAESRTISLRDGGSLRYDAALIATGGEVVTPPFPGGGHAGVFTLRTQADAKAIVAKAERSQTAIVIGASFIGMEAAAALRERGLDVTVLATEAAPFEKQLGAEVGQVFQRLHESYGVRFRFGIKIARIEGNPVSAVVLEGGERVAADLVIAGLGVRPATGFVRQLARPEDQGLLVDASLRLREGLFAAGDVAAFPGRGLGGVLRVEHWRVAEQQGRVAAHAMLGLPAKYDAVPFFWTIQYMKRLDYAGHASATDDIVIRGDLNKPAFIAYYLRQGEVAAAAGFDQDQDMAAVLALMSDQPNWRLEDLHPPASSPSAVLARRQRPPAAVPN